MKEKERKIQPDLHKLLFESGQNVIAVEAGESLAHVFSRVEPDVRSAVQAITYHTIRNLGTAQTILRYLTIGKSVKHATVRGVLLVAISLLVKPEKGTVYKTFVVVDQAVTAVRQYIKKGNHQAPFVNALLRTLLREFVYITENIQFSTEISRWNYPEWWIEKIKRDYPLDFKEILQAGNSASPLYLRVNRRQIQTEELKQLFSSMAIAVEQVSPYGLKLLGRHVIHDLPGYREGYWTVRDIGAQKIIEKLPLRDGQRVLDACAAPGGKTSHMLERANIQMLALDQDASRLERVQENLKRLDLLAETRLANCMDINSWWDGECFDVIVADVPCTASGIVSRHPEIKWLRRESDILQSVQIQYGILEQLWQTLKPGGVFMYVTCSIFPEENAHQVKHFLQATSSAVLLEPHEQLLPSLPHADTGYQQNGFFYAILHKKTI